MTIEEVLEEQSNVKGRGEHDIDSEIWSQRSESLASQAIAQSIYPGLAKKKKNEVGWVSWRPFQAKQRTLLNLVGSTESGDVSGRMTSDL